MCTARRRRRSSLSAPKSKPALLHLKTYRLFGHAGADAEVAYRKKEQIEGELEQDPLLYATALLLSRGVETAEQLAAQIEHLDQQIARVAHEATQRPKLPDAAAVDEIHSAATKWQTVAASG